MRSSKAAKAIAILLALLMLIPAGVYAKSDTETTGTTTVTTGTEKEKTTMDKVKEYLYSEDYHTYKQEHDNQGWKDATGDGIMIEAAKGYTFEADPDYPEMPEVLTDPEKGQVLHMPEAGKTSWKINVPVTGYYVVRIEYMPYETKSETKSINTSNIKREFYVDGESPFSESYYYEFTRKFVDDYYTFDDGTKGFRPDKNGNDKKPQKYQIYEWSESYLRDSQGYELQPLKYALTKGEHTITFNATMNDIVISYISVEPYKAPLTYEEYLEAHGDKDAPATANAARVEAEMPTATSDLTIYALNDRTSSITYPQDAAKQRLNTIGDSKWQTYGQWIEWTIPGDQITEDGYYYIVPRFKQSAREGLYVSRVLYINGEIPNESCYRLQFNYSDDWQCSPLNDGTQDLKFWFEAGKDYKIKMEVGYGNMSDTLRKIGDCIDDMNDIYRSIIRITGPNPDEFVSYGFAEVIYDTILLMRSTQEKITDVANDFKNNMGGKSASDIATLEKIASLLKKMSSKESEIAKNLENLKVNTGYLGTWVMNTKLQALNIDFITLQPAEKSSSEYPRGRAGFWKSLGFEIKAFFASFFTDYNSLGATDDKNDGSEAVEVWIATSREEAQVMRELIDLNCPVKVNLKLVAAGTLLPATLAQAGPDISLAMGQTDVINYAIRKAVVPLYTEEGADDKEVNNSFDDYLDVCSERFSDQTLVGLRLENSEHPGTYKYYGIPERLSFSMLFYRKDIFAELDLEVP